MKSRSCVAGCGMRRRLWVVIDACCLNEADATYWRFETSISFARETNQAPKRHLEKHHDHVLAPPLDSRSCHTRCSKRPSTISQRIISTIRTFQALTPNRCVGISKCSSHPQPALQPVGTAQRALAIRTVQHYHDSIHTRTWQGEWRQEYPLVGLTAPAHITSTRHTSRGQ